MLFPLKLERHLPLQQQLHDQLRGLIESGALSPGHRMPSSRVLAEQHSVSRMTVVLTYERLIAAGLLHTTPSGGTFVAAAPVEVAPMPPNAAERAVREAVHSEGETGRPDPDLFPASRWRALLRSAVDTFGITHGARTHAGYTALQDTLATWLRAARGIGVLPGQIMIAQSRQQALEIAVHMLLSPGLRVAVESPGDSIAGGLWRTHGARLVPVPVDNDGMVTDLLASTRAALAHVSPVHQTPLGVVLSMARRAALLEWAAAASAYIVEADHCGDLRYDHERVPALMADDTAERVLHIGDFAGVLGPWLTTAYLVVPPHLIDAAMSASRLLHARAGGIELGVLAEFIASSAYSRHLLRVRRHYASRRDALRLALRAHFGPGDLGGAAAGFAATWIPPQSAGPLDRILAEAEESGLKAEHIAVPRHAADGSASDMLLIGFGHLSEEQISHRVGQLAKRLHHRWPDMQAALGSYHPDADARQAVG